MNIPTYRARIFDIIDYGKWMESKTIMTTNSGFFLMLIPGKPVDNPYSWRQVAPESIQVISKNESRIMKTDDHRYNLWEHLLNEHGVVLTDGQLNDIIHMAIRAANETDKAIAEKSST